MNKVCASILVFIALFALAQADGFKRLPLEQGVLRMRNLATATTAKYSFDNFTNNTAVSVNMSSTYLTANNLDNNTQTDMLLWLHTNATGFCPDCSEFVKFSCATCTYDKVNIETVLGPYYKVNTGYPFNFSNLTIGDGSAWKLNTFALYTWSKDINTPVTSGPSTVSYFRNYSTYGYIGMGVGGNASKNFQTTTPIFSIQVNGSGSGSLIFGKDTTLYDSSRTAITLTTNTNWTTISRNVSLGNLINNTNYISNVIFDLQFPGVALPYTYYYTLFNAFASKYNLTQDNNYGTDYNYIFTGNLSTLPTLIIGLTNDKNITLPPSAYTRKVGTNMYTILLGYVNYVYNNTKDNTDSVNYTVLGWPVLSQFYTVFELPTTGIATVTMYPTYDAAANGMTDTSSSSSSSSFSLKTLAIVAAIVLIVLVALSAVCKKKTDFTKSDLGVELRAARV